MICNEAKIYYRPPIPSRVVNEMKFLLDQLQVLALASLDKRVENLVRQVHLFASLSRLAALAHLDDRLLSGLSNGQLDLGLLRLEADVFQVVLYLLEEPGSGSRIHSASGFQNAVLEPDL